MLKSEIIYSVIDTTLTFIGMLIIYKYIYAFYLDRVKKLIPYFIGFVFIGQFLLAINTRLEESSVALLYIAISTLLFMNVERNRFRHILWIIPITFTGCIPSLIMALLYRALEDKNILYSDSIGVLLISNIITLIPLFIIYKKEKKYNFLKRIRSSERFTITITSTFICFFSIGVCELETISIIEDYSRIIIFSTGVSLVVIIWVVIKIMIESNSADYYMQMSKLNENNIKNLLDHFESYKLAQENTRKIRHDIKNHLACIKILSDQKKLDEIQNYIESLNEEMHKISDGIQVGNSIVDAILNEKTYLAQKEKIIIEVDGRIVKLDNINPMDWCVIFSNAIDNAIEASRKLPCDLKRKILIKIKTDRNHLLISIENLCISEIVIVNNKIKSKKKDKRYHGFGIENIKSSVRKYNGDIDIVCDKEGDLWRFTMFILLPLDK